MKNLQTSFSGFLNENKSLNIANVIRELVRVYEEDGISKEDINLGSCNCFADDLQTILEDNFKLENFMTYHTGELVDFMIELNETFKNDKYYRRPQIVNVLEVPNVPEFKRWVSFLDNQ